jgi:indolepyruvate ferredoxin oxidoreductase beta subunit
VNKGRRVRSDQIGGFLLFWMLGGLRGWRRKLLRHASETDHIESWLEAARSALVADYDLAVAILRARRLIKGYSDTHARGLGKFDKVMSGAGLLAGRADAAEWTERLIRTALADPKGEALDGALQTVRSFAVDGQA